MIYFIWKYGEVCDGLDYNHLLPFASLKAGKKHFKELKQDFCYHKNFSSCVTISLYQAELAKLPRKRLAIECLKAPIDWKCFSETKEIERFLSIEKCGICKFCKEEIKGVA